MRELLDHLGVTVLAYAGVGLERLPLAYQHTWHDYANAPHKTLDILANPRFNTWLRETELTVLDDLIGHATIHALAVIYGFANLNHLLETLNDKNARLDLLNRLQARIRIVVEPSGYASCKVSSSFPQK